MVDDFSSPEVGIEAKHPVLFVSWRISLLVSMTSETSRSDVMRRSIPLFFCSSLLSLFME